MPTAGRWEIWEGSYVHDCICTLVSEGVCLTVLYRISEVFEIKDSSGGFLRTEP